MRKFQKSSGAFTLIELLVVIAIMAMLTCLSVPLIGSLSSTYERRAAVDVVMTAVEKARIAALQSGENVSVIMARATDSGASPDALLVVGDRPIGSASASQVVYTRWTRLPHNIRFRSSSGTLVTCDLPNGLTSAAFPAAGGNPLYSAFTFNSTGQLVYPTDGASLLLALYEGTRGGGGEEVPTGATTVSTQNLTDAGLYNVIYLSRYSGRTWADVSNLVQK